MLPRPKEETECELPFLLENGECNTTIFSEFEDILHPFKTFAVLNISILILLVFLVLTAYVRAQLSQLSRSRFFLENEQKRIKETFFRYNFGCLLLSFVGLCALLYCALNSFLLELDLKTTPGKINASLLFISFSLLFLSNYSFLPVLRNLLGVFAFSTQVAKRFNNGLKFGVILSVVTQIPVIILFLNNFFDIHSYLSYIFSVYLIHCVLLVYLLLAIIDNVITQLKKLTDRFKNRESELSPQARKTLNSQIDFCRKLRSYKRSVLLQSGVFSISLVILIFPDLTKRPEVLIYTNFYSVFAAQSVIPVLIAYSRYIIPGQKKCIRYSFPTDGNITKKLNSLTGSKLRDLSSTMIKTAMLKNTSTNLLEDSI
eukprot:snap_masked-scaffold_2-processed-gene-0.23-mRNA-1 protein AED:1.00 eAED:1.00 QI:0/-1/0/0/-1/1/1/0/371